MTLPARATIIFTQNNLQAHANHINICPVISSFSPLRNAGRCEVHQQALAKIIFCQFLYNHWWWIFSSHVKILDSEDLWDSNKVSIWIQCERFLWNQIFWNINGLFMLFILYMQGCWRKVCQITPHQHFFFLTVESSLHSQFHSLGQDQSTMALRAETTVDKCSLYNH